jgi:hypothetical protein
MVTPKSHRRVTALIEIDGSYKAAIGVLVNGLSFGHRPRLVRGSRPSTGEHDYLKGMRLLGKQCAEPLHAEIVALNELIIEDKPRSTDTRRATSR